MIAIFILILMGVSSFYPTAILSYILWVLYTLMTLLAVGRLFAMTEVGLKTECIISARDVPLYAVITSVLLYSIIGYLFISSGAGFMAIILSMNVVWSTWMYVKGKKLLKEV